MNTKWQGSLGPIAHCSNLLSLINSKGAIFLQQEKHKTENLEA